MHNDILMNEVGIGTVAEVKRGTSAPGTYEQEGSEKERESKGRLYRSAGQNGGGGEREKGNRAVQNVLQW